MKRLLSLCAAAAALAACAPRVSPLESFPIGMFGVEAPEGLKTLRAEGFTAAQTYQRDPKVLEAMARAARGAGLLLLAHPQELLGGPAPKKWPLAAWYLVDEPDVSGLEPEKLRELDAQVKRWSPGVGTAFVVGDGRAAARYAGGGDALMVDWYPVPHLPLESLGEHVRLTAEAAAGKPVWAVLQAFNWKDYPQNKPRGRKEEKPRIGRFPDIFEMRFMSYDAVLNGARGLWYFAFRRPDGSVLPETPEEWFAVTEVSREMAAMRPIFAFGKPARLPFMPTPEGVAARAWRYRGSDYVVILNRRPGLKLKVPEVLLEPRWRPLFEARRDPRELLDKYMDAYYLPPYRVMAFESRLSIFGK